MAMFDFLTDAFTGAPAKNAAKKTQDYLTGVGNTNNAAIDTGALNATSAVNAANTASRDALGFGYNTGVGDVNAGGDAALGYLDSGANAARAAYGTARAAYDPVAALGDKYGGATTLALNSLGVNGATGTAAARDAFTNTPGYEFNRDQGIEAINRRRNMGGMLDSGNADRDAQTFGAGLASQQYDTWMNNLLGFTNPELQATSAAASGRAGVDQNLAGMEAATGVNKAGVETGRGAMLADLASKYGLNLASTEADAGRTLGGIYQGAAGQKVGQSTALAQPYADTYGQEAAAQQQGSGNFWNLATNLAALGTGQFGKAAGTRKVA